MLEVKYCNAFIVIGIITLVYLICGRVFKCLTQSYLYYLDGSRFCVAFNADFRALCNVYTVDIMKNLNTHALNKESLLS